MKYLKDYGEGDRINGIYMCKFKQSAITKGGKPYENVILQDKTGVMDAKIWDPNDAGIDEFDKFDYIEVGGEVNNFQGSLQVNIRRARKAFEGEYDPADYLPVSKRNIEDMMNKLYSYIDSITDEHLKTLLNSLFREDEEFIKKFKQSSAAKSIHHGFVGGLLEHTLCVTSLCSFYCKQYPALNRDLLLTAAMCHDIGKTRELSAFPENEYTDEGQLLGHIVIGSEMVAEKVRNIVGFPAFLAEELKHCIISHHGELTFGSPKKPAIIEAVALNFADNTDAKIETFTEALENATETGWLGFNKSLDSNIHSTVMG